MRAEPREHLTCDGPQNTDSTVDVTHVFDIIHMDTHSLNDFNSPIIHYVLYLNKTNTAH